MTCLKRKIIGHAVFVVKELTVVSIFLHLNIKNSETIRTREEQQFEPFKCVAGELGDGELILT